MQIKEDIYGWLVSLRIINSDGKKLMDRVEIPKMTQFQLESGILFGKLLKELSKQYNKQQNRPQTPLSKLDTLKEISSSAARLYNWNILIDEYNKVGVKIDQDTKGLILSGDTEMMHELLKDIYNIALSWSPKKQNQSELILPKIEDSNIMLPKSLKGGKVGSQSVAQIKQQTAQQQVDLSKLDPGLDLKQTHNCLEFFIIVVAKHLQLSSKQAASLFTNNNKFLAQVIAKGVKGVFEPIIDLYKDIIENHKYLIKLFLEDVTKKSIVFTLQALKTGLIGKSFLVAKQTSKLFKKLAKDLIEQNLIPLVWDWFINEEGGGLNTALMSIKRHPDLAKSVVNMILQFARYNFVEVFTHGIKRAMPEIRDLLASIEQIFQPLSKKPKSYEELINTGIIDEWIDLSYEAADQEFKYTTDVRIQALSLIVEIWMKFPQKVEESDIRANKFIQLLKRASRDRSQAMSLISLNNIFRLLNNFGQSRNSYAPLIYKTLALSMVENHGNSVVREFIFQNLINTFQKLETIPFSVIVEPLVKQIQMSENVTYIINIFDMMLFQYFAGSERLGVKNAIQLLDLLAKVFLNNIVYASTSQDIIIQIISRHQENLTMQEFVLKFMKIALAMFYSSEKKKKPKDKLTQSIKNSRKYYQQDGNQVNDLEYEMVQAQKRGQIVEIMRAIIQLQQATMNEKIRPLIAHTNFQIKQFGKKNSKGMMVLMSLYGDADALFEQYELEYREMQAQNILEKSQLEDQQIDKSILTLQDSVKKSGQHKQLASLSQLRVDPKIINELQQIKKNFNDKIHSKEVAVEILKEQNDKQKQILRKQLEQRSLEQGVASYKKQDIVVKLIFKEGTKEKYLGEQMKHTRPQIELTDFEIEEDREKLMVDSLLKKYHKILKYLFLKYSNSSHVKKQSDNFDDKKDTINIQEMWNFIKDFKLEGKINKDELPAIYRIISIQILNDKTELKSFNFDGFKIFLVQFSMIVFGRSDQSQKYTAPSSGFQQLIGYMRNETSLRGQSTQLFDDPEQQFFQDAEVIKQYNQKLLEDPKFPLPEGYKTIREPNIQFKYDILQKLGLSEAQKVGYEILNDLLQQALGTNLIEPITRQDFIMVCRPNMLGYVKSRVADRLQNGKVNQEQNKLKEQKQEEDMQKKLEQDKIQKEWENSIRMRAKEREKLKQEGKKEKVDQKYTMEIIQRYSQSAGQQLARKQRTLDIDVYHKPTIGMRLGISKLPYKDRPIAEQVAIVLDDILYAVEYDKKSIQRQVPIINKWRQEQDLEKLKQKEKEDLDQKKYMKQQNFIKSKMEQLKQDKAQKKNSKEEQDRRKQTQEERKSKKEKKEQYQQYQEKQKSKLEEFHKEQSQLNDRKNQEQNQIKIKELEDKKSKFSEFNRERIKKFKQELKAKKEEKEKANEDLQEKQQKDKNLLLKLASKIEEKSDKVKSMEHEINKDIANRMEEKGFQDVFQKNNFKLSYFFELLQMEFFNSIEWADNKDFIQLQTWMWFGERFNLYPEIISRVEFVRVFTILTHKKKQKNPKLKAPEGIDYLEFLQGLIRISIKGANIFNQIAKKIEYKQNPSAEEMEKIANDENKLLSEEEEEPEEKDDAVVIKRQHQTKEYMKKQIKINKNNQEENLKIQQQKKKDEKTEDEQALLIDNYKHIQKSTPDTLNALIYYLMLPEDKIGIELRFRMALEKGKIVPNKQKRKQLMQKLEQDLDKWNIEHQLTKKSKNKKKNKKIKPKQLFDQYGNPLNQGAGTGEDQKQNQSEQAQEDQEEQDQDQQQEDEQQE